MSDGKPKYTQYGSPQTREKLKQKRKDALKATPKESPYPDGSEARRKAAEVKNRKAGGK